jgi:hypothetical protein
MSNLAAQNTRNIIIMLKSENITFHLIPVTIEGKFLHSARNLVNL